MRKGSPWAASPQQGRLRSGPQVAEGPSVCPTPVSCHWTLWMHQEESLLENRLVVAKGEGKGGRMDWEFGVSRCKLVYIGEINHKVLCTAESVSSVPQSCPTLCDPMGCSTPGLPVHHQLPEFTQT